jgi:hypothetical protein
MRRKIFGTNFASKIYISQFVLKTSSSRYQIDTMAGISILPVGAIGLGWTVVDNEPAIDARIRSVDGAKRGAAGKARATQARDVELASEYQARRSKPGGLSVSALMQEIGKSAGLGRTASIEAIKRGLQKLK